MPDLVKPVAGDSVVVVQGTASGPFQQVGVIVSCDDAAVFVQFKEAFHWDVDSRVIIVRDVGSPRVGAAARPILSTERVSAFQLIGDWGAFNLRSARRYPTAFRAKIHSTHDGRTGDIMIVDISIGGMAVEGDYSPDAEEVMVTIEVDGVSASLPCKVVQSREQATRTQLHLRFKELAALKQAFVRSLVELLEAEEHVRRAS
jgi:hypothetical protein